MYYLTKYLFISVMCISVVDSYRILIMVPTPSYSHHRFFHPLVKEISLRGHQVVHITPKIIDDPSLTNLTEVDLGYLYKELHSGFNMAAKPTFNDLINKYIPYFYKLIDDQLSSPEVQKILNDPKEHFDMVMVESFFVALYPLALNFKCPLVLIRSGDIGIYTHHLIGNPITPSYISDMTAQSSRPRTFSDRLENTMKIVALFIFSYVLYIPELNRLAQKHFGPDIPPIQNILPDFVISNANPILFGVRPNVPIHIGIGGSLVEQPRSLPKDLQMFLDEAKEGVVYFSLGTNVHSSMLREETRTILKNAFSKLPYKVIWKIETGYLENKPDNVLVGKFFPQTSILAHSNVKAFITQGGAQSMEEAIHRHVPMVGIPFVSDQMYNVDRMVELGIAVLVEIDQLSEEVLIDAINEIVKDKYKKKITEIDNILRDEPMTPINKAIWWIEYVVRHNGTKFLQSRATKLPFYQFMLLDILAFVIFILLVFIFMCYLLIKSLIKLWRYCKSRKDEIKIKTE